MISGRVTAIGWTVLLFATAQPAFAADLPIRQTPPVFIAPPAFTWSGPYLGAFLGGGSGTSSFSDPRGASIYGNTVRTPFLEGGGQIGYNFQLPAARWVVGAEADGGAVGLSGAITCLAHSGFSIPDNCSVNGKAMASGTGRIGYAFGPQGRTLAYVKGGFAALFEERDVAANASGKFGGPFAVFDDRPQVGFTVGAGLEQALTNAWSLKIEYDYTDFGSSDLRTPLSQILPPSGTYRTVATGPTSIHQSVHELKVGLNYHFGAAPGGASGFEDIFAGALSPVATAATAATFVAPSYEVKVGARYWYSFGRYQKDLAGQTGPNNVLNSRLTYSDESSSGEVFGRIDTPVRVFVKGFVGAGGEMGGQHNDEDFRNPTIGTAYSNTVSGQAGTLDYATADLGYAFLDAGSAKLGGLIGYNYYKDDKDGLGCQQTTGVGNECAGTNARPTASLGITQHDRYNSLRLGANAQMSIGNLRLEADAAYLPLVGYNGVDDHLMNTADGLRLQSGRGQGVQLELLASYDLTTNLSVGIGGRYWAFWVPNGTTLYTIPGTILQQPVRAERYGLLAQATYHFSGATPAPVAAKY